MGEDEQKKDEVKGKSGKGEDEGTKHRVASPASARAGERGKGRSKAFELMSATNLTRERSDPGRRLKLRSKANDKGHRADWDSTRWES